MMSSFTRHGPNELIFGGKYCIGEYHAIRYDFYLLELKYKMMAMLLFSYYHKHMSMIWCSFFTHSFLGGGEERERERNMTIYEVIHAFY